MLGSGSHGMPYPDKFQFDVAFSEFHPTHVKHMCTLRISRLTVFPTGGEEDTLDETDESAERGIPSVFQCDLTGTVTFMASTAILKAQAKK